MPTENDVPFINRPRSPDDERLVAARAVWEDLATRARALHCPEHVVAPWRVRVVGDRPEELRLETSGCCPRLGQAVNEMIAGDPRITDPS